MLWFVGYQGNNSKNIDLQLIIELIQNDKTAFKRLLLKQENCGY